MHSLELLQSSFDIVGTVAFAASGSLLGISRRMDIFGMAVLALATAMGGGIIRDVLAGHFPPNTLQSSLYISLSLATTVFLFFWHKFKYDKRLSTKLMFRAYLLADALGLASFTVTGTSIGLWSYPQYPMFCVILGLLTAVGGGVIRDVLAQRVPSILREDVYALPAIIGALIFYVVATHYGNTWAFFLSFTTVFVLRVLAIRYNWNLPRVGD